MRLGMFMHPIHDFRRGYNVLLREDMDVIRAAEAEGFDEVWLGEHFFLPGEPFADPLMIFAALAHECRTTTFGSGVLSLPNMHPAIVAGRAAQFDHLVEGRFMMGIGPGGSPPDFEAFGVDGKDRAAMLEEAIDHIVELWTTAAPYAIRGPSWQTVIEKNVLPQIGCGDMARPYQQPHPPFMLPSMSPNSSSARLAARRGWHSISANFVPAAIQIGHWRAWADEKAKHGLPLDAWMWRPGRTILVTETDQEAKDYLAAPNNAIAYYFHYIITLTSHGGFGHMLKSDPDMPDSELTPRYCIESMVIAGSPRTVAEQLAEHAQALGPFETLITSHRDWDDRAMWRRHMHLLAHEVMPILRDLLGRPREEAPRRAAE